MADRPHSRQVKIVEGTAEGRKGERIESDIRASERERTDRSGGGEKEDKE